VSCTAFAREAVSGLDWGPLAPRLRTSLPPSLARSSTASPTLSITTAPVPVERAAWRQVSPGRPGWRFGEPTFGQRLDRDHQAEASPVSRRPPGCDCLGGSGSLAPWDSSLSDAPFVSVRRAHPRARRHKTPTPRSRPRRERLPTTGGRQHRVWHGGEKAWLGNARDSSASGPRIERSRST